MPRGPKPAYPIRLNGEQTEELRRIARLRKAAYDVVLRAKILLLAWEHPGWSNMQIAQEVGTHDWTVRKWRKRWCRNPVIGDAPRAGAPRFFPLGTARPDYRPGVHTSR
jgi:hypothetical protein